MIDNVAKFKKITVITDTAGWFDVFAHQLVDQLNAAGHSAKFHRNYSEVTPGDLAFYLSCMKITPKAVLAKNNYNFVVHASDLPKGRGFSPIVWQVLEGRNDIPVTMISMAEPVDSGKIVAQTNLRLEGHELNDEMRSSLAKEIIGLCIEVANLNVPPTMTPQAGEPSWYDRRYPRDSELNTQKTIAEQFNLLRVVDNERYPAFFTHKGQKYIVKINKDESS